jgi:hypothetical protein
LLLFVAQPVAAGGAPQPQSFGVLNLGSGVIWSLKVNTLCGGPGWLKATCQTACSGC